MEEFEDLSEKIISQSETVLDSPVEKEQENDELMEILLNTREQGQMMEQLIKNQIEVKDEMINKLHKELDYYKQDSADRFVDQVMKAIIKVRKDMKKSIDSDKWPEYSADDLRREYSYIFEDLTDLLEQQNVDAYSTEPGSEFDASIHQPKLEETDDPSLDKKVKESLAEGYKKGDKVIQPERVVVYQFKG